MSKSKKEEITRDEEELLEEEALELEVEENQETEEISDSELTARDLPAADRPPLDVREIPLDEIAELGNIRPAYHGLEQLADTMHLEGQLQPVVVRESSENSQHGKQFELIFGHRRKRAAELLEWQTIRAEVRPHAGDDKVIAQMIIENYQRSNMDSPVAEANAFKALKYSVEPPMTNAAIARKLGCDPSHVSHRLKMIEKLSLPQEAEDNPQMVTTKLEPAEAPLSESPVHAEQEEIPLENELVEETSQETTESQELQPIANKEIQEEPKHFDILALVDQGVIDGSTAEVIASLESREDQEKLAKLCVRNEWGVKKAASWARAVKKNQLDEGDDDIMGKEVEMLKMEDVTELQSLKIKPDITEQDINNIVLYALLRNGLDREILDYLADIMNYPYENLWDYVISLDEEQVAELTKRLALRYVSAAHRFFDLEPTLKDMIGIPEEISDEDMQDIDEKTKLSLPGEANNSWDNMALPEADDPWAMDSLEDGEDDTWALPSASEETILNDEEEKISDEDFLNELKKDDEKDDEN